MHHNYTLCPNSTDYKPIIVSVNFITSSIARALPYMLHTCTQIEIVRDRV